MTDGWRIHASCAAIVAAWAASDAFAQAGAEPPWDVAATAAEFESFDDAGFEEVVARAKQGDAKAQFFVGLAYEFGMHRKLDAKKAHDWFLRSAEQGNGLAEGWVGDFYFGGWGVPMDYAAARMWYGRAAEDGYLEAIGSLADMDLLGLGGPRDRDAAIASYERVVTHGVDRYAIARGITSDCVTPTCEAVEQIVVDGRSEFQHIRGQPRDKGRDPRNWEGALTVPGADRCSIMRSQNGDDEYSCLWERRAPADADAVFGALVASLEAMTEPWESRRTDETWGSDYVVGPSNAAGLIRVVSMDDTVSAGRWVSLNIREW